jgi:hypothetical protein
MKASWQVQTNCNIAETTGRCSNEVMDPPSGYPEPEACSARLLNGPEEDTFLPKKMTPTEGSSVLHLLIHHRLFHGLFHHVVMMPMVVHHGLVHTFFHHWLVLCERWRRNCNSGQCCQNKRNLLHKISCRGEVPSIEPQLGKIVPLRRNNNTAIVLQIEINIAEQVDVIATKA